jgi:hypothetical protein
MPPGPLPNIPQILPRQPGESAYSYRNRRSIALSGETLYERRQRLGRARGFTAREAAGHREANEAQVRRQRTMQGYGVTPWQFWRDNQVQWLIDNGFQPETTGWSWNRLIRIAPRIRYMNEHLSLYNNITPELLAEGTAFELDTGESDWSWERLNEHYEDVREFYEHNNPENARLHFFRDRIPELSVQWWYYR